MGRKLVLTGTKLTNLSAPRLPDVDPIESAGSLLLVDFTHPAGPVSDGVPVNGQSIPNLLASTAAGITGASIADVGNAFAITGGFGSSVNRVERTARGGVHTILSQTPGNQIKGDGVKVNAGTGLRTYMAGQAGKPFYVSTWFRVTRVPRFVDGSTTSLENPIYWESGGNSNSAMLGVSRHLDPFMPGTNGTVSAKYPGQGFGTTPNVHRMSAAVSSPTMAYGSLQAQLGMTWGPGASTYNQAVQSWIDRAVYPSFVGYRYYVEDLTVSGRTYAEVDAIDRALYEREVLTAGGRYYGDTFTDPATIA